MDIYGGWGLLMFLEPLCKYSGRLSYIFFITIHPVTFVSLDNPTFLHHRIFVLGGHQEVLNGNTSFKIGLYPIFVACSLQAFTQPLVVWHHYIEVLIVLLVICIVIGALLLGWCFHLDLNPTECPCGVPASCQYSGQMVFFLL